MQRALASVLFLCASTLSASADPVLKIINFTADWCPNCQILDPRLDEAVSRFEDGAIEIIPLDLTETGRRYSKILQDDAQEQAMRTANAHGARHIWEQYKTITGLAIVMSADTGEPLICFERTQSVDQIEKSLNIVKIITENAPAGKRTPDWIDCPPPRYQDQATTGPGLRTPYLLHSDAFTPPHSHGKKSARD